MEQDTDIENAWKEAFPGAHHRLTEGSYFDAHGTRQYYTRASICEAHFMKEAFAAGYRAALPRKSDT